MNTDTEQTLVLSSRKRRIAAFFIDHFVMSFLMVAIVFLALGSDFMNENNPTKMFTTMLYVMLPGFLLYFAKDCIKGISVGKWIMGIMIRDENNPNEIPSIGRLLLRNLFIMIWPVEFIVLATNDKKKRLGDKVAKTIVVKNPITPKKLPRIMAIVVIAVSFFAFTFLFAGTAIKHSNAYKISINKIEQNEEILNETGGIKGYGIMPSGSINISNGHGQAQFQIKVLGNKTNMIIYTYLEKEPNGEWELIEMQKSN